MRFEIQFHFVARVQSMESKRRPAIQWFLLLFVVISSGYGFYWFHGRQSSVDAANAMADPSKTDTAADPARATAVVATVARETDMPIYLRGLGTVVAYNTVTVRSRVDGELAKVNFTEGQYVTEGDVLAEIDKRPFEVQRQQGEAQLAQAKGNLARDTAILKGATTEFERNIQLLEKGIIPKQQQDMQGATVSQYEGSIEADRAAIDNAQATIDNANLQLTYSRVTAPISGLIGLRAVDPGNIVRANDPSGLAVITQIQPITILFNIPEDNLGAVLKKLRSQQALPVEAFDRDEQTKLAVGKLLTVDNEIDQTTGTSRLKAVFDNHDNQLFPNQFVTVHMLLDTEKGATVIPVAAIQQGPQGTYVYVVDSDQKARIRYIKVKNTEGKDASIGPELKPGEIAVTDGTDKVEDGAPVNAQVSTEGSRS
jgi:multidrug efflux system membrane fusion protein